MGGVTKTLNSRGHVIYRTAAWIAPGTLPTLSAHTRILTHSTRIAPIALLTLTCNVFVMKSIYNIMQFICIVMYKS